MEQVIGYPGQQVQISHSFKNPDNTQSQTQITGIPVFRVTSPEGQVVVDTTYHSVAGQDLPEGVLPGQAFSSGAGRWSLLWSIPEDATLGSYRVEVSASVNGYGLVEEVGLISVRPAWRLSVEGSARRKPKEVLAYSCWFQVSSATTIRLNRGIWQMIQADQVRRPISPGGIFARAQHESGSEIDLLPLTSLTLQPGWTRVTVSAELFMVPAVDRLYQPVGYSSSADRYAKPMNTLLDPTSALFPQGRPSQQLVNINPFAFLLRTPVSAALKRQVLTFRQVISREDLEQAFISGKHSR